MATPSNSPKINEVLADAYETLKQHEQVLVELSAGVEALNVILTEDQKAAFQRAREKKIRESAFGVSRNFSVYDATIARLRGSQ